MPSRLGKKLQLYVHIYALVFVFICVIRMCSTAMCEISVAFPYKVCSSGKCKSGGKLIFCCRLVTEQLTCGTGWGVTRQWPCLLFD